jgi:hypothetical protein
VYELRSRNERAKALSFRGGGVIGPDWWCIVLVSGHKWARERGRRRGGRRGLDGLRRAWGRTRGPKASRSTALGSWDPIDGVLGWLQVASGVGSVVTRDEKVVGGPNGLRERGVEREAKKPFVRPRWRRFDVVKSSGVGGKSLGIREVDLRSS